MSEQMFKVGDKVILGKHQAVSEWGANSANWSYKMDAYVGCQATITSFHGPDGFGVMSYRVDIDGGYYVWRGINMTPVNQSPKITAYGASCIRCKEYNFYAEATPDYTCYSCRGH